MPSETYYLATVRFSDLDAAPQCDFRNGANTITFVAPAVSFVCLVGHTVDHGQALRSIAAQVAAEQRTSEDKISVSLQPLTVEVLDARLRKDRENHAALKAAEKLASGTSVADIVYKIAQNGHLVVLIDQAGCTVMSRHAVQM